MCVARYQFYRRIQNGSEGPWRWACRKVSGNEEKCTVKGNSYQSNFSLQNVVPHSLSLLFAAVSSVDEKGNATVYRSTF